MYTIEQVTPEEFRTLKAKEQELLSKTKSSFNGVWSPKVRDINVSLEYNPKDNLLGFILERADKRYTVNDGFKLTPAEEALIGYLSLDLEARLKGMRSLRSWTKYIA